MANNSLNYDEAIGQIEAIMTRLRTGEMSVDQLAAEVKRAAELIAYCKERLLKTEEELKKVLE